MTYYVISNDSQSAVFCYVRTTERAMSEREFCGGFRRFLREAYTEKKVNEIDGHKVLNIRQFDKWRNEHNMC